MQSSTMVVLRTLVMLAALVAVPAAAMFGSSLWPRLVRAVSALTEDLEEEPDSQHKQEHGHDHDHQHEPAGYSNPTAATQPMATPATITGQADFPSPPAMAAQFPPAAVAMQAQPPQSMTSSLPPPGSPPPPAYPHTDTAQANAPLDDHRAQLASPAFWPSDESAAPGPVTTVQHEHPQHSHAAPAQPEASQAIYAAPIEGQAPADPQRAAIEQQRADIEQRLQAIGALHYRLETAGQQGELFRFQCKMGLERNPNYVSYFESTSGDPVTAMRQVLDQVESWRAGATRR